MNILTDLLPDHTCINGNLYSINPDFRAWIKVTQLFCDRKTDIGIVAEIFEILFKKLPNEPIGDIMNAVMQFYSPSQKIAIGRKDVISKRQYDFDYDGGLIYAGFFQQYGIDLSAAKLHWWQFKELLNNLSDETQFVKVIGYRSVDLANIKDREQKKYYKKMKALYRLPDNRTEDEKERDFCDALAGVF